METCVGILFAAPLFFAFAACGGGDGSNVASGAGGGTQPSGSTSGSGGQGGGVAGSTGSGTSTGGNSAEICDGIDNDGNGIIDDVDVGGDGICDCLRIATLGIAGTWGEGNVFSQWLDDRSDNGAVSLGDVVLSPSLLEQYQVIVAQDLSKMNRSYAAEEVDALKNWVEAGGGFMTLIGYADTTERVNANALLAAFGMSYQEAPILPKGGATTIPVTNWVAHPVTQGVTQIGVDNGYAVAGNGITLASEQGHAVLQAQEVGLGHVLMWGDEWITYDSEWTGHPEYQVETFWINAIKWLTPVKDCQVPIPQ